MIEITRPGKYSLMIPNPVMIASGMMGFDPFTYRNLIAVEKLGAVVTSGVSWRARGPAHGTRVVPRHDGFLLHTGLPNLGMKRVIKAYSKSWQRSPIPVIVHIIAAKPGEVTRCAEILEGLPGVVGIELGLHDQVVAEDVPDLIQAARERCQLPILVRLPLYDAPYLVQSAQDGGADALVIAAPPRGTERDTVSGKLIGGRLYGPWLKPLVLRIVGQVAQYAEIPIIACGGIHTSDDARDFIEAGAVAVQIDTLTWVQPGMVETIARNLGGSELTRAMGAMDDEWQPGQGKTQAMNNQSQQQPDIPPPELPLGEHDHTEPADPLP